MKSASCPQKPYLGIGWATFVAGGLGFILNTFPVHLGNDLHLIFGVMLPLMAAMAFGPLWGLCAAVLAALATKLLWQHGLAIPFLAAEAFVVGWCVRRWRWNAVFADAAFWVVASPALYIVHVHSAFYPDGLGAGVALKYIVNGLLCATLADASLGIPAVSRLLARYGATFPDDTLAGRLTRLLTLVAVVPVCFLAIWYARAEYDRQLSEVKAELVAHGQSVVSVTGSQALEVRRSILDLADRLSEIPRERSALSREVVRFQTHHPVFETIIVTDAAGDIIVSHPMIPDAGLSIAGRTYVQSVLSTREPFISEGFQGNGHGSARYVAFSAPLLSPDGAAQGVVAGWVAVTTLESAIAAGVAHGDETPYVVVDRAGQILVTTQPDLFPPQARTSLAAVPTKERVIQFDLLTPPSKPTDSEQVSHFWMWQSVEPITQWRCYTLVPFSVIRGRAALVFIPVLLAIPFVLLAATWASRLTTRLVMYPLSQVTEAARALAASPDRLAAGQVDVVLDTQQLPVEIVHLTEAFHAMALKISETVAQLRSTNIELEIARQRLEDARDNLEKELARRTAEIERREKGRLQSQKLESLGQLAGGIAHNFNNLLTVVLSYSSLELGRRQPDDPICKSLNAIRRAAERGRDLVKQLMSYSRASDAMAAIEVSLQETARSVQGIADRLLGEEFELSVDLPNKEMTVKAVPQELEQVFLNLLLNARDAMPQGGRIAIEAALVTDASLETGGLWLPPTADLRQILTSQAVARVSVRDTGTGMTPEVMSRLCEPFFTTKPEGKGTGLGLSTVFGTVTSLGGSLRVESEVGKGTAFHVYLPVVDSSVSPRVSGASRLHFIRPSEQSPSVLVVEDELDVRQTVMDALTAAGFRVIGAQDGAEAWDVIQQRGGRFDLVISDVRMPNVNGIKLASSIREHYPAMPVLFISGYADQRDTGQHFAFEDNLLYKPFTTSEIVEKARSMLDKARSRTT
ncbi:MAG: response regulator [Chloracidobacterium sp.]